MSPTRLSRPGIYLFRPPGLYTSTLDRETLILFSVRFPKVLGAALYRPQAGAQSAVDMLESLLAKMRLELDLDPSQITVKVFGMRTPQLSLMKSLSSWIEGKGMKLGTRDTGKGLQRQLLLDVQNCRVGVSYSPSTNPFFLAKGSLGDRAGVSGEVSTKVLLVTHSRVKQALAKAAIEEIPGWRATTVSSFEGAASKVIAWDIILLADDITWTDRWAAWLEAVAKHHPHTRFAWSGERAPYPAPVPFQNFPVIDDKTISAFKSAVSQIAQNPLAWPASGTLPFRRIPKRRT